MKTLLVVWRLTTNDATHVPTAYDISCSHYRQTWCGKEVLWSSCLYFLVSRCGYGVCTRRLVEVVVRLISRPLAQALLAWPV